jgi:phosphate transport system protein
VEARADARVPPQIGHFQLAGSIGDFAGVIERRDVEEPQDVPASASSVLLAADGAVITQVRADEPTFDRFQMDIDREAIRLITVYSPVACDLRCLLMIARINSELERIGDEAMDTCRWLETLDPRALASPLEGVAELSRITLQMVEGAMEAFAVEDIDRAQAAITMHERIDAIEARMVRDLAISRRSHRRSRRQWGWF